MCWYVLVPVGGKTRFYNIVFGTRSLNSVLVRLSTSRSNTKFCTVLAGGDVAGVKVSLNPEVPIELVFACVVIVDSITFLPPTPVSVVSMKKVKVAR